MPSIELQFLGTGTSAGVPMIACDCAVCTSTDPRDQRNRCSVVIRYPRPDAGTSDDAAAAGPPVQVLVDTTPELRLQAVANKLKRIDTVVYTHAHADHIMGLDDMRRFNAVSGRALDLWADATTMAMLRQCFGYAFKAPDPESKLFRPHLVPRVITPPERFEIEGVEWTPVPLVHGKVGVLGFRVGDLAYCTDVNEIPAESWRLLEGTRVLVIDALQWTKHATHFTIEEAIDVARRLGAEQTWLTHIAHGVSHEESSRRLPEGVRLAYDGLTIECAV